MSDSSLVIRSFHLHSATLLLFVRDMTFANRGSIYRGLVLLVVAPRGYRRRRRRRRRVFFMTLSLPRWVRDFV